jgi:hypothetical protein
MLKFHIFLSLLSIQVKLLMKGIIVRVFDLIFSTFHSKIIEIIIFYQRKIFAFNDTNNTKV